MERIKGYPDQVYEGIDALRRRGCDPVLIEHAAFSYRPNVRITNPEKDMRLRSYSDIHGLLGELLPGRLLETFSSISLDSFPDIRADLEEEPSRQHMTLSNANKREFVHHIDADNAILLQQPYGNSGPRNLTTGVVTVDAFFTAVREHATAQLARLKSLGVRQGIDSGNVTPQDVADLVLADRFKTLGIDVQGGTPRFRDRIRRFLPSLVGSSAVSLASMAERMMSRIDPYELYYNYYNYRRALICDSVTLEINARLREQGKVLLLKMTHPGDTVVFLNNRGRLGISSGDKDVFGSENIPPYGIIHGTQPAPWVRGNAFDFHQASTYFDYSPESGIMPLAV